MLKVLIVDDESPARNRLQRMVDGFALFSVAGTARSGEEALEAIAELQPQIILLDISMPGMGGMALARALQRGGLQTAVIFCTAYQNQALEAFEVEAIDYLVKPVREERLKQALEKARLFLGDKDDDSAEQYLHSSVGGKKLLTPIARVICLMAEDKYTTVVHEKGRTIIEDSLTELEKRFPDRFFRVHRNALISRKHIRGVQRDDKGHARAVLSGTDCRPEVSRRNLAALRGLLSEL